MSARIVWAVVAPGGVQHAATAFDRAGVELGRLQCLGSVVPLERMRAVGDIPFDDIAVCHKPKCRRMHEEHQERGGS